MEDKTASGEGERIDPRYVNTWNGATEYPKEHPQGEGENMEDTDTDLESSFGANVVGLSFNPSGNADVQKVKRLCAQIINIVDGLYESADGFQVKLCDSTVQQVLLVQMSAVKAITYGE